MNGPAKGNRLRGRVALVTGAGSRSSGIGNGRAAAILFARQGASVLLIDSIEEAALETKRMIDEEGGIAEALQVDVTSPIECDAAVRKAAGLWGRLDILVNNVGIGGARGTAVEVDLAEWEHAMRVNVTSMMLMAKYAIPEIRRQGAGAIVNIASVAGLVGGTPHLFYPASKGAVVNMTRAMATHHGPEGIRVNCVCPGMVYTPMMYAGGMPPELREARRMRSLLQTEGTGWDVGHAVLYLASDEARWLTGVILPVDAGTTAGSVGPHRYPRGDGQES